MILVLLESYGVYQIGDLYARSRMNAGLPLFEAAAGAFAPLTAAAPPFQLK